jgi:zinc and cadmium transporter
MISYCKLFAIVNFYTKLMEITYALIASLVIASLSFLGALFIGGSGTHPSLHRYIIPTAIGLFLGVIFLELIPETLHGSELYGALSIAGGFIGFYFLSHILRTYHHHHDEHAHDTHEGKAGAKMLLIGDGVHNISDGVVIVGAFLLNPAVGIATTLGIALHEVAQEVAEYGVLIHAGYTRTEALIRNFLSASTIFIGVILGGLFVHFGDYLWVLTGIAAGNLLYIVASDMIPEVHAQEHRAHFKATFVSTVIGFLAITALITFTHGDDEDHSEHEGETHSEEVLTDTL